MKVIILGGFLGSGKTTLLLNLAEYITLKHKTSQTPLVIIENEIGEISVDGSLLGEYRVKELFSGCICCTLAGDLASSVIDIKEKYNPEYIIIEATGMAHPHKIAATMKEYTKESITTICMADVIRWDELMDCMDVFITNQLKGADIILLNKCDLITPEKSHEIAQEISQINPQTRIKCISAKNDNNIMAELVP